MAKSKVKKKAAKKRMAAPKKKTVAKKAVAKGELVIPPSDSRKFKPHGSQNSEILSQAC